MMSIEKFNTKKNNNKIKEKIDGKIDEKIEREANYEDNHTLLMIERLTNPIIFERLVNDIYEDITTVDYSKYDYINPEYLKEKKEYIKKGESYIKKDIRKAIKEKIDTVMKSTEIDFSKKGYLDSWQGYFKTGSVGILSKTEKKIFNKYEETPLLKNMSEAHEKGHNIRNYNIHSLFTKKLLKPFDFDKIKFSSEDIERIKKENNKKLSDEDVIKQFKEYFSNPWEIIERMSQLKNYFGMNDDEKFTKKHLDYARKHYIKDTKVHPSQIQYFFDAIVDDDIFINLMNTLGI